VITDTQRIKGLQELLTALDRITDDLVIEVAKLKKRIEELERKNK